MLNTDYLGDHETELSSSERVQVNVQGGEIGAVLANQVNHYIIDNTTADPDRVALLQQLITLWEMGEPQGMYTLEERSDLILRPFEELYQEQQHIETPSALPKEQQFQGALAVFNGDLLLVCDILTEPNVVARGLALTQIANAEKNLHQYIPLMFDLRAWPGRQCSIMDWIVSELHKGYGISEAVTRPWLEQPQILPIFIGFERLPKDMLRAWCASLDKFRAKYIGPVTLVTTLTFYLSLRMKLRFGQAFVVRHSG